MKVLLILLIATASMLTGACNKDEIEPDFSDADRARCVHINREVDLGEYLYWLCLNYPWPSSNADLPPATSEGLSTFGFRINDTLTFINWRPNTANNATARARLAYYSVGQDYERAPYRTLIADRSNYEEVDPRRKRISLTILPDGTVSTSNARGSNLIMISNFGDHIDGQYAIDTNKMSIEILRWDNRIIAGKIEAWFVDPDDSTRKIHVTEGRFDLTSY